MGRIEILEPAQVASFYAPVILFQHVVLVLAGAVVDVLAQFLGDGLGIAGTAAGRDLFGLDLSDGFREAEERPGGHRPCGRCRRA